MLTDGTDGHGRVLYLEYVRGSKGGYSIPVGWCKDCCKLHATRWTKNNREKAYFNSLNSCLSLERSEGHLCDAGTDSYTSEDDVGVACPDCGRDLST